MDFAINLHGSVPGPKAVADLAGDSVDKKRTTSKKQDPLFVDEADPEKTCTALTEIR